MSQDSGNNLHVEGSTNSGGNCETSCKRQRVGLMMQRRICSCDAGTAHQLMFTYSKDIDETHKKHMRDLEEKQNMQVLEFFCYTKEKRERMDKVYKFLRGLICEPYGDKVDKLKKLDEMFQIKLEGLRREMNKCWENLKADHETARTNEEEMRSKMICLLNKRTASTLPEDSDNSEVSVLSTSGNRSSLEIVEVSPDNPPMEDLMAIHGDPGKQIQEVSALGIVEESIIPGPSSMEQLDVHDDSITPHDPKISSVCSSSVEQLKNCQNQAAKGLLCSSVPIADAQSLKEGEQSVPVPVDEHAGPCPSPRNQLDDVLSASVTPDNNHASQNPITESQRPWDGMRSSDEVTVPSDKIGCFHDTLCKDTHDEPILEVSASTPVNELQHAKDQEEVPSTSGWQQIDQHKEAGVATVGSSPCLAIAHGGFCSMDQDTTVEELRQQTQTNTPADLSFLGLAGSAPCSIPQQQCTDQGRHLPLEQAHSMEPPCSDIRVTDGFSSLIGACFQPLQSSTRAYQPGPVMSALFDAFLMQTGNHLMIPQVGRGTEENTHLQLSYMGGNYQPYNSSSFDARSNSHQPASFDPLQIQLKEINKFAVEALKKHKDMKVQLEGACEQEKAQIDQKYNSLFQNAESNWIQNKEELKLWFKKTEAQKLLADAWTLHIKENSPLDITFLPGAVHQSIPSANGMQRSVSALSHQFANQLSDQSMNRFVRPPSFQVQSTLPSADGMQWTDSADTRPPFANHFSHRNPIDQTVGPPYPLYSSQGRWGPYVPDPSLRPSLPNASIPLDGLPQFQMNQHALNFCSSSSSTGSFSQPYNFADYPATPYNALI